MQRVEGRARITAPPDDVFAYLADLERVAEWQSGVVSAEQTSEGEMRAGATARVVREVLGQRVEAPLTVTVYEPPRRLVIGSEVSGVKALASLDLAPADGGTTDLRFAMEIRGSMMTSFLEPMIASAAERDLEASLERVKRRFAPER